MNCKQFHHHLDSYFDRELAGGLRDQFLEHKNSCGQCRKLFAQREELFGMMAVASGEQWTIDIANAVMKEVESMPVVTPVSPFRWPLIIAAGCSIIVGVMIFIIGLGSVVGGFSVIDATKALISIIDLPDEVHQSVDQLITLGQGMLTGLQAVAGFMLKLIKLLLLSSPYIFIPLFALVLSILVALFVLKNKFGSKLAVF